MILIIIGFIFVIGSVWLIYRKIEKDAKTKKKYLNLRQCIVCRDTKINATGWLLLGIRTCDRCKREGR